MRSAMKEPSSRAASSLTRLSGAVMPVRHQDGAWRIMAASDRGEGVSMPPIVRDMFRFVQGACSGRRTPGMSPHLMPVTFCKLVSPV